MEGKYVYTTRHRDGVPAEKVEEVNRVGLRIWQSMREETSNTKEETTCGGENTQAVKKKSAASEKLCNFEPEDIGEVTHDDAIEESETVEKGGENGAIISEELLDGKVEVASKTQKYRAVEKFATPVTKRAEVSDEGFVVLEERDAPKVRHSQESKEYEVVECGGSFGHMKAAEKTKGFFRKLCRFVALGML